MIFLIKVKSQNILNNNMLFRILCKVRSIMILYIGDIELEWYYKISIVFLIDFVLYAIKRSGYMR